MSKKRIDESDYTSLDYAQFKSLYDQWIYNRNNNLNTDSQVEAMVNSIMPICVKTASYYNSKVKVDVLEDLTTAGKIAALKALHKWDSERGVKFSTYVFLRISKACMDYLNVLNSQIYHNHNVRRRIGTAQSFSLDANQNTDIDNYDFIGSEDKSLKSKESNEYYHWITSDLKSTEKEIADMYFVHNLNCSQIGERLGMTKQGVWSRLQTIIQKSKTKLK